MLLKAVILVLLLCVIASLFSGLWFFFKDVERDDSKRTWYALGIRIAFAAALVVTIFYGIYTGQLQFGANAPWHGIDQSTRPARP